MAIPLMDAPHPVVGTILGESGDAPSPLGELQRNPRSAEAPTRWQLAVTF